MILYHLTQSDSLFLFFQMPRHSVGPIILILFLNFYNFLIVFVSQSYFFAISSDLFYIFFIPSSTYNQFISLSYQSRKQISYIFGIL